MTRFGDALVEDPDVPGAARRAVEAALAGLSGRAPDLVCAFVAGASPEDAAAALQVVAGRCAGATVLGATAAGVLGGGRGVEGGPAVSAWAAALPGASLRSFHLEVLRGDGGSAVVGLPERAEGDEAVLLLADPWSFPADGFVERAGTALPGLPFVGGLAAGARAGGTRLLVDGHVHDRGAVGVVLAGTGARAVVSQGCRPVGPPMTVTQAAGNVVRGLAGAPAVERVRGVLADLPPQDQALASRGLHLGLALDEYAEEHEQGDFLVRAVLGTEPETGGLVVGDLVEVGRTVRLQVRDAQAASDELHALLAAGPPAGGVLLASCAGRGAAFFGSSYGGADHDVRVVRDRLGADAVAGFFSGGELGPVGGRSHLHTQTACLLAFP